MRSLTNLLSIKNFTIVFILAWLGLFILVPGILVILVSFFSPSPESFYQAVFSLESYTKLVDPTYLKVFENSLYLALWTTLFTFIVGYLYALAVVNCKKKWHAFLLILVLLPFWTNSLVRIYGIKNLLGANGFINQTLISLGIIDSPLRILYTDTAVIIGMVSILLPYMILPIYSSLQKIDHRLIEAAKDLGAGPFRRFTKIIFPLSFPGVVAGFTLVFLPSMGLFYISELLGGPKSLLIGSVIKSEFLFTRNWPLGAALSIAMIIILMFTMWLVNRFKIGRVE
ncbi:spermidine/putrescine ABC transporter permease [Psittacicella melopsittaci]|uniref:Spermidine/putrescine ABC transporter permease n=1 Tax=Psittacicella melopsittaci TaxID=2028576 RepID=A0A3A1Y378_9GAMM|nr:ABC transporter permease subunit [Psittacicella melopsittaci]RIY31696.1 spermidine/putrescine ABC transporter permease [Psittacicella melopsittaci]